MGCSSCNQPADGAGQVLTLGMAVKDEFATASHVIQSARLHQGLGLQQLEIVVVDNGSSPVQADRLKSFCGHAKAKYVWFPEPLGTSAPRDEIFKQAAGSVVCVTDAHVLMPPNTLARLLHFGTLNPQNNDLWHGPMLYDWLTDNDCVTHMRPIWGEDLMYGKWSETPDPRGVDPNGPPFEIPMHGLGLFACRRDAWLGFPAGLRGFGGEEGMVHELFAQHGRKTLCLPFLRWWHLFRDERETKPAPIWLKDKFRNYLIWYKNLGKDTAELLERFQTHLRPEEFQSAIASADVAVPKPTLDAAYQRSLRIASDISEHCPTLKRLAMDCEHVTEFNLATSPTTAALLAGQPDKLVSFAISPANNIEQLEKLAGQTQFFYDVREPLTVDIEPTDLLVLRTRHTKDQLLSELIRHAPAVRRWIVVTSALTYGMKGEDGGPGTGVALVEFMRQFPEWSIVESHAYGGGMLVLSRDPRDKKAVPSIIHKLVNFTKASFAYTMAGQPNVPEEIFDLRIRQCLLCDQRNMDTCGACGCPFEKKALWATESCPHPDGPRWPALLEAPLQATEPVAALPAAEPASQSAPGQCKHEHCAAQVNVDQRSQPFISVSLKCSDCGAVFSFDEAGGATTLKLHITPALPATSAPAKIGVSP